MFFFAHEKEMHWCGREMGMVVWNGVREIVKLHKNACFVRKVE